MNIRSLFALSALILAACPGDDDTDTDVGTDVDTEAPSAYALPDGATGVSGTMTYSADIVGFDPDNASIDTSCLAEFAVSGSEFTGDCNDCEWAFELDVTESSNDCADIDTALALLEPAFDGTTVLVYWPEYYGAYASYADVLAAGSVFDYNGTTYASFAQLINLDYYGSIYGADSFNYSETGLDWSISDSSEVFISDYEGPACSDAGADYALAPIDAAISGTSTANGTLPCDQETALTFDTFTIAATEGDDVTVSVDTIATATAFDSWMKVIAPSGCEVATADDIFDCSFPPADYQCSGFSFNAQETGDYLVLVGSYGSCNDGADTGSYVFASTTDAISTVSDDVGYDSVDPTTELTTDIAIDADLTFEF